jgi:hypothetical protein
MEEINKPVERFPLHQFYHELDGWIETLGAEATVMNIEDGVMAILRYKVAGKPHINILSQHADKSFCDDVHLITISSQRQIDSLKAAITHSYV